MNREPQQQYFVGDFGGLTSVFIDPRVIPACARPTVPGHEPHGASSTGRPG